MQFFLLPVMLMNAQPRVAEFICPCCGGLLGQAAPIEQVLEAVTSPSRHTILLALSSAMGHYVTRSDIINALSAAGVMRTDKPQPNTISVQISTLRKEIARYGWTIVNSMGASVSAQYRLIPTESFR